MLDWISWLIWKIQVWFMKKNRRTCVHCGGKINYESLVLIKLYNVDFDLVPGEITGDSTDFLVDLCGTCFQDFCRDHEDLLDKYIPRNVTGSKRVQKIIKNSNKVLRSWYE